ncbi:uncharacterized protein LOC135396703 [Ornithodoros turicata]|uniref:uncharacterized protein LOC135396703 n=1 Tax=Ornithodoros turicata TaxID=34597 RepID=UPI00313A41C4
MNSMQPATVAHQQRVYVSGSHVSFEEDNFHEFKAHRDMSVEDVSPTCKENHSRQCISRTICAFLNTGLGGTVYLGILDSGKVTGLYLTEFQRDHILLSLENLLTRYAPPVPKHMCQLRFVRVVGETESQTCNIQSYQVPPRERLKPHEIQSSRYCWCDRDACAQRSVGAAMERYVVEIEVFPWDGDDPRNKTLISTKMHLHPMFENEEDICFIRRQGSNIRCTMQDVIDMTRQEVRAYYTSESRKKGDPS